MVNQYQLKHISKREGIPIRVKIQAKGNSERSKELSYGHVILNCVGNNEVKIGR